MELQAMRHVLTEATIENLADLYEAERRIRAPDQVRSLVLMDALVGTETTTLALPTRFIRQLGLKKVSKGRASPYAGAHRGNVCEPVRLTIQGRFCSVDVIEVPDDPPVLIGQIPLVMLDLVVDVRGRRLTGNPAHGGEHVLELY